MLHKRRKKDKYSSTHPSTTFINNLLHSKSTYFYKWGEDRRIKHYSYLVPSVCILALLTGLYMSVNPNILRNSSTDQVYALDITTNPTDQDGTGGEDDDTVEPSLSLTINGNPNEVTPARVGEVAYRTNSITVSVQNYNYYAMTLYGIRGSDSELHGKNNPFALIEGVGKSVASDDFRDNTWGYAITADTSADPAYLTYNTVPAYDDYNYIVLSKLVSDTIAADYKLSFAAKFGADAPSDNYQRQLILSVVGMAAAVSLDQITTMQEMTGETCVKMSIGQTKQLEDIRDRIDGQIGTGKKYWIEKLADGNCWMTQNLDYNIKVSDFTGAAATKTGNAGPSWSNDSTAIQSWDPGDFYYTLDTDWTNCGDPVSNMSACSKWATTAPALEGEHYHVGNYYSWNAATAGTGSLITSDQASSSICPTGWKLPTSHSTKSGSFGGLMNAYGLTDSNVNDRIRQAPLYFTPAGQVYEKGLSGAGNVGFYWSSTPAASTSNAYNLDFWSNNVRPSPNSGTRSHGFSVRCLADF